MFKTQIRIHFRDADPARIMFFANIFDISHNVFEEFIEKVGFSYADWFKRQDVMVPIRHAECDYLAPLFHGEVFDVSVGIEKLGETSFKIKYNFSKNSQTHAVVHMVHAYIDPASKQKVKIPNADRNLLEKFLLK